MADTTVKYFSSAMTGAPVMTGTAGALVALLDACLVNGFGLKTVDTLVVATNVATATISSGHSAQVGSVVLVAGASPAGLNGEHKVTEVSTTTIKFGTAGISDQSAAGSITLKMAPAGWNKIFAATNFGAYKSSDVLGTGCVLRIDDTDPRSARITGFESMSDINTGVGQFPTEAQLSGGIFWTKSNSVDATPKPWVLVADQRGLYISVNQDLSTFRTLVHFGDFNSYLPSGDTYGCMIHGDPGALSQVPNYALTLNSTNASQAIYVPRSFTGVGASQKAFTWWPSTYPGNDGVMSGQQGTSAQPYPNPVDGGLYVTPLYVNEVLNKALRGNLVGLYATPQSVAYGAFNTGDAVSGVLGAEGRTLRAISSLNQLVFVDTTGPWR